MEIRFAQASDIPGMLELLQQVGEVHHQIRPDLFRSGAQKYDEAALEALLTDENRPIFVAWQNGQVAGYAFCIRQTTQGRGTFTFEFTRYEEAPPQVAQKVIENSSL